MQMKTSPKTNHTVSKTSDVSAVILYSLIIFCVDSMIYDQHYFTWKNYGSVADVLQLMKTTYLWTETVFLLSEKTS